MKQQNYRPEKSRWFIVFLLFCAVLLAFFARMNISLALPFISGEYAWALSEKGIMSTGTGLINGLGNTVGVLGPIIMGLLIAWSGNYDVALSSLMIFLGLGIFSLLSLAKEEKLKVKSRRIKTPGQF